MEKITLKEYKDYLIDKYVYEMDNLESRRLMRVNLLNSNYNDEYLERVIIGTYNFIDKIIKISENNYYGSITIPLDMEPMIMDINLNVVGGFISDTVVSDSDNNFYSIGLLKKIFGSFFYIEPCRIDFYEEIDEDDDFCIVSEIPTYYLYIQCEKEIIDSVKNEKVLKMVKK